MAVPLVPLVPIGPTRKANGTKDTNGTGAEMDLEERIAMALEGGVPPSTLPPSLRSTAFRERWRNSEEAVTADAEQSGDPGHLATCFRLAVETSHNVFEKLLTPAPRQRDLEPA